MLQQYSSQHLISGRVISCHLQGWFMSAPVYDQLLIVCHACHNCKIRRFRGLRLLHSISLLLNTLWMHWRASLIPVRVIFQTSAVVSGTHARHQFWLTNPSATMRTYANAVSASHGLAANALDDA